MDQFRHTLVPLHVALPLAGAVVFLMIHHWKPRMARTFVMANVLGSVTLSVMLVAMFLSRSASLPDAAVDAERSAAASMSRHSDGPVSLSFAVDGMSLMFAASIPLVVLCSLLLEPPEKCPEQPLTIAALLVGESAALTVLMVHDVVLLSAAFGMLGLSNWLVVGSRGGPGVRSAARWMLLQHVGATALISISLAGTAVACSHMLGAPHALPQPTGFNLDELVQEVRRLTSLNPPAELVWRQLAPWLFVSLAVGCCIWSGVFPFHIAFARALRETGPLGRALLGGVTLKAGVWGLIRIALPLFPDPMTDLGPFLMLGVALSALYCAISMNGTRIDAGRDASERGSRSPAVSDLFLAEGAVVVVLLSACGVLSQTRTAIVGATLLLIAHMLSWMLYLVNGIGMEAGAPPAPAGKVRGPLFEMSTLAGLPGLALFPGLLLMFVGISVSPVVVERWLAMLLLLWLVIVLSGWAHLELARVKVATDGPRSARLAAALLTAAILWIGIAPGTFTAPLDDGVRVILQQPLESDATGE